jgi:hypothetical protein
VARLGIALVAAGVLLRAALYFPLALFQIDSDGTLAGLCAFRVAAGAYPLFFPGCTRLSAASCYVAAGYFHLLGDGRVGLALTGLTWGALYVVFSWLFLRALLGDRLGCVAMIFVVVPPEQFMTVTYVPWAYGEIMASCAATLWLATLWRQEGRVWQRVAFGLSAGFGIWISLQTLMVLLPAFIWIAWRRRTATVREALVAGIGFVVGALPFIIGNAANGAASVTHNWASQAAPNGAVVVDNVVWFVVTQVPQTALPRTGRLVVAFDAADPRICDRHGRLHHRAQSRREICGGVATNLARVRRSLPAVCYLASGLDARLDCALYRAALSDRSDCVRDGGSDVVEFPEVVGGRGSRARDAAEPLALQPAGNDNARRAHAGAQGRRAFTRTARTTRHPNDLRRLFLGLPHQLR